MDSKQPKDQNVCPTCVEEFPEDKMRTCFRCYHKICVECLDRCRKVFLESRARGFISLPDEEGVTHFEYPANPDKCGICKYPLRTIWDPVANDHVEHQLLGPRDSSGGLLPCPCDDCEAQREIDADDSDFDVSRQRDLHQMWIGAGRNGECQCVPCTRTRPVIPFRSPVCTVLW